MSCNSVGPASSAPSITGSATLTFVRSRMVIAATDTAIQYARQLWEGASWMSRVGGCPPAGVDVGESGDLPLRLLQPRTDNAYSDPPRRQELRSPARALRRRRSSGRTPARKSIGSGQRGAVVVELGGRLELKK